MDVAQINAFLEREFPQIGIGRDFIVEEVGPLSARLRLVYDVRHLRPGGTMSGPSMFALADVGIWVAILAQVGPLPLIVTTNLNINFLRLPEPTDLVAEMKVFKLGKRLAVGEALLYSAGGSREPVAHATGTYSIPPR